MILVLHVPLQVSIQQQTLLVVNGSGHVLLFKLAIQPGSGRPADGKVCLLSVGVCVINVIINYDVWFVVAGSLSPRKP